MIQLANKTAVITGASRGIGAAVAKKFAQCGANVALLARSEEDIKSIAKEIGDQALPIVCDVSNYADVKNAMTRCAEHFGGVDVCVNNAGIIDPIARIEDSDPEHWGNVVDINVKGVYFCLHAVYPFLKEKGGLIINLSSVKLFSQAMESLYSSSLSLMDEESIFS